MQRGHIISNVTRCVSGLSTSDPLHVWPRLFHGHLDAFSAASVMLLKALRICSPTDPRRFSIWWRDWPAKPLQPTLMGSHWVFHLLFWHMPTSSSYFNLFISSSHRPSPYGLFRGQSTPAVPLVFLLLIPGPCLAWVWSMWCCLGI